MGIRRGGKRFAVGSYLSEILDVVNGTGRRIRAVLALRYEGEPLTRVPAELGDAGLARRFNGKVTAKSETPETQPDHIS